MRPFGSSSPVYCPSWSEVVPRWCWEKKACWLSRHHAILITSPSHSTPPVTKPQPIPIWSDFYFTVSTCGWLSGEDYRSKCEQEKNCTAVLFEILLLFCVDIILIAVDYPLRWHIITDNAPVKTTGDAGFLACSKTAERAFSKTEGVLFLLKPIHVFSLYLWL